MCAPPALCKVVGSLATSQPGGLDFGTNEVPTRLANGSCNSRQASMLQVLSACKRRQAAENRLAQALCLLQQNLTQHRLDDRSRICQPEAPSGRVLFWGSALAAVESTLALATSLGRLRPIVPPASLRKALQSAASSASRKFAVLIRVYA